MEKGLKAEIGGWVHLQFVVSSGFDLAGVQAVKNYLDHEGEHERCQDENESALCASELVGEPVVNFGYQMDGGHEQGEPHHYIKYNYGSQEYFVVWTDFHVELGLYFRRALLLVSVYLRKQVPYKAGYRCDKAHDEGDVHETARSLNSFLEDL